MGRMIYCIDVDGTICTLTEMDGYANAKPFPSMIKKINKLYDDGHTIKIATARGQVSGKRFLELTEMQLKVWGVKYHELMEKTAADFYIDDKAMTPEEFINCQSE